MNRHVRKRCLDVGVLTIAVLVVAGCAEKIDPNVAAGQAAMLASHGAYREALQHLALYERLAPRAVQPAWWSGMPWLHAKVFAWQGYWPREISILQAKLRVELQARHAPGETD